MENKLLYDNIEDHDEWLRFVSNLPAKTIVAYYVDYLSCYFVAAIPQDKMHMSRLNALRELVLKKRLTSRVFKAWHEAMMELAKDASTTLDKIVEIPQTHVEKPFSQKIIDKAKKLGGIH